MTELKSIVLFSYKSHVYPTQREALVILLFRSLGYVYFHNDKEQVKTLKRCLNICYVCQSLSTKQNLYSLQN